MVIISVLFCADWYHKPFIKTLKKGTSALWWIGCLLTLSSVKLGLIIRHPMCSPRHIRSAEPEIFPEHYLSSLKTNPLNKQIKTLGYLRSLSNNTMSRAFVLHTVNQVQCLASHRVSMRPGVIPEWKTREQLLNTIDCDPKTKQKNQQEQQTSLTNLCHIFMILSIDVF